MSLLNKNNIQWFTVYGLRILKHKFCHFPRESQIKFNQSFSGCGKWELQITPKMGLQITFKHFLKILSSSNVGFGRLCECVKNSVN